MAVEREGKIIYKKLSYKIMSCAFEVYKTLGPGFSENIYEEALAQDMTEKGLSFERQKVIDVYYKGIKIGEYRLDFLMADKVILEVKAVSETLPVFSAQVLSYLKAADLRLGIVLNFGEKPLGSKRIVN